VPSEGEIIRESSVEGVEKLEQVHRPLSRGYSRAFVGSAVGLVVLAALAYRYLLFWDPSGPGLPDVGWFFFGIQDTAPQIVFAITAFLLYQRRGRLARVLGREGSPLVALPLLGTGVAFFLWAHHVDAPDLLLVSFLPFCLGSAALLLGAGFAREMALPVLLLAFAIPMPGVLTNQIVFPLQLWNAELASELLNFTGTAAAHEGDMVYLADRSFEIIETCSGLRAMMVLAMLAVAFVCYFPARWLHVVLLVGSACLIGYLLNAARVLTVILHPGSQESFTHALQGVMFFVCGSAALYGADAVLRRWLVDREDPASASDPVASSGEYGHSGRVDYVMALAILLGLMLGASIWMPRWSPPESQGPTRVDLPREIGEWETIEGLEPDWYYLGSVGFSERRYRRYGRDGETVSVFAGYDDRLSRSRSLFSRKNGFPGRGWEEEERALVEIGPEGFQAVEVVARSRSHRILSYYWYRGVEGLGKEVLRAWLGTDRSFLRRPAGALVIRLSTEVPWTGEGRSRAETRLREFAELLLARSPGLGDGS
jgi:EpsI family protein